MYVTENKIRHPCVFIFDTKLLFIEPHRSFFCAEMYHAKAPCLKQKKKEFLFKLTVQKIIVFKRNELFII